MGARRPRAWPTGTAFGPDQLARARLSYRGCVDALVTAYLRQLEVPDPGAPSVEGLRRLHIAHVERIPYETIGIALGRPVGIAPEDSVARIVAGWGGYCYHLNGA